MAEQDFLEDLQCSESVFVQAEIGMALADGVTGKWLRVNSALSELLGYSTQDLLQHPPEPLVQPRDSDGCTREMHLLHRTGSSIPCRVSCSRLPVGPGGSPLLLLQIQSLEAAALDRDDKTAVFTHSVDLLAIATRDGYLKELNPAWEETLGWSTEELKQTPFIEFVHPDDRKRTVVEAQLVHGGGRPSSRFRNRYRAKDGGYRWLEWNARPQPSGSLVCTVRDVTEQVALENELHETSLHLNQVTESVPALLFQWYATADGDSGFRYFNGRSDELYGIDRETLLRDWRQIPVHPDDWPLAEATIENAVREQREWLLECRMLPREDDVRWVHCESTPTSITEKEIVFTGVILDITEQYEARKALKESEARFRRLAEGSLQGIVVESIVDGHRPLFVNEAAARIYGFGSAEEVMALPSMKQLAPPEALAEASETWEALAAGEIDNVHTRIRALHKDGTTFWVELMGTLIQWQGKPAFQMTLVDVTEEHLAQEALKASEQRLRTIADNLPILMAYTDRDYRYRFNNQTYTDWFGVARDYLYGKTVLEVWGSEVNDRVLPYMERALSGERVRFEIAGDGTKLPPYCEFLYIPVFDTSGEVAGFYTMGIDISDRRQHAMFLERQNLQDGLTGLTNRRGLLEQLPLAIKSSREKGGSLAILFLDLDRFKQINDTFGHEAGDKLLTDFAQRLKESVRDSDVVVRLAGDEFVLLLANLKEGRKAAQIVADKIIAAMQAPFSIGATTVSVSTSIGICVQSADEANSGEMLKQADQAMYQAKRDGRNRYRLG